MVLIVFWSYVGVRGRRLGLMTTDIRRFLRGIPTYARYDPPGGGRRIPTYPWRGWPVDTYPPGDRNPGELGVLGVNAE